MGTPKAQSMEYLPTFTVTNEQHAGKYTYTLRSFFRVVGMLVKRCSVSVLHPTNWGSSIFPMTILECCLLESVHFPCQP